MAKSIFGKIREVHHNKTYNLIYTLIYRYLPTSLALEKDSLLNFQYVAKSNDELLLMQERGEVYYKTKTLSD